MDCKEHLIYFFLQGKISLSQYDQKFLTNLQLMVHRDSRITTNQAALFDKLISKYARQLTKNGLDKETLKELPWKANVVTSSTEFTGARVSLKDDTLILRVPFNKNFIAEFRDVKHNPFEWQRDDKVYSAPYSTYGLKILKENLHKYFPAVMYCELLEPILSELKAYEAEVWDPTLVKVNGRLMVIALNSILGDLVENIELNDDPLTMFKLSQLGIKVHPSLIVDAETKFASEFITEVDLDDLPTAVKWMQNLGINMAVFGRGLTLNKPIKQTVISILESASIKPDWETKTFNVAPVLLQYHNQPDTRAYYSTEAVSKCVLIKNSRPIEVR